MRRRRKNEEKNDSGLLVIFFLLLLIDVCRRPFYLSDANNDLQFDKKKEY